MLSSRFGAAQTAVTKEPARSRPSVRAQLIGSWRLVSRQSRKENGEVETDPGLSATPLGILIYDQSGQMAAQLFPRSHPCDSSRGMPSCNNHQGNSGHCPDNSRI